MTNKFIDIILVLQIDYRSKEQNMHSVSVSPKFQVVIPKEIREKLKIKSGEHIIMIPYENRIELIRKKDIKQLRGILKGMDTTIIRDKDRE